LDATKTQKTISSVTFIPRTVAAVFLFQPWDNDSSSVAISDATSATETITASFSISVSAIPDVVDDIAPPVIVDVSVNITDITKALCHYYKNNVAQIVRCSRILPEEDLSSKRYLAAGSTALRIVIALAMRP